MYKRPDEQTLNTARYLAILEEIERITEIDSQTFNNDECLQKINAKLHDLAFAALKWRNYPVNEHDGPVKRYVLSAAGKSYQSPASVIDEILNGGKVSEEKASGEVETSAVQEVLIPETQAGTVSADTEEAEAISEGNTERPEAENPDIMGAPAGDETVVGQDDEVENKGLTKTEELSQTIEAPEKEDPAEHITEKTDNGKEEDAPDPVKTAGTADVMDEYEGVALTNDIQEYKNLQKAVYGNEPAAKDKEEDQTAEGSAEYMFNSRMPKKKMNRKRKNKSILHKAGGQATAQKTEQRAVNKDDIPAQKVIKHEQPDGTKQEELASAVLEEEKNLLGQNADNELENDFSQPVSTNVLPDIFSDDEDEHLKSGPINPADEYNPEEYHGSDDGQEEEWPEPEDLKGNSKPEESELPVPDPEAEKPQEQKMPRSKMKQEKPKGNGFFSIFKKKQPEEYKSIIESTPTGMKTEAETAEAENSMHNSENIFMHVHTVTLKKKFGNEQRGPYKIYIWPIWIIDKFAGYQYADILALIEGPGGNRESMVSTLKTKECYMTIDGLQFNIYAVWNTGMFESHVALYEKTESIYMIAPQDDVVTKYEPEVYKNAFLNKFRKDIKNIGKHFVVPMLETQNSDGDVPIAGYIDINRVRTAFAQTGENVLYYRAGNKTNMIRGKWEEGSFTFDITDKED